MLSHPPSHPIRRSIPVWRLLATALGFVVLLSTMAAAQASEDQVETPPRTDTHEQTDKVRPAIEDVLDAPADIVVGIKLNCHGVVENGVGAVGCAWRTRTDRPIASWQLWNLQTRPELGARNLVAELGADARSYRDTNVVVPAAYVYAIVGLDADGSIVARSRLDGAALHERQRDRRVLRLDCLAHGIDTETDTDAAISVEPNVSIGCEWSRSSSPDAVGYQLWRSVDGGERHVVARTGLDQTSFRDDDVSVGHRYRYIVTAVDSEGHITSRSRAEVVSLRRHDRRDDRVTDAERDQVRDRPVDGESDRPGDGQRDRVVDAATDHVRDRAVDAESDRPGDGKHDRAVDGESDRPGDGQRDRVVDAAEDHGRDRAVDAESDRPRDAERAHGRHDRPSDR